MKQQVMITLRNRYFPHLPERNFFMKLLCSYLAIILICVSGMGFVSYNILQNTVKESSLKENDRMLYQLKNTIDSLVFSKTDDLSVRMLEDTFSNKTIAYYFTEEMSHNIYDMSSVLKYCKTIKTLNPMLLSAGFYFEKNQLYICSEGVQAPDYGFRSDANLLATCKKLLAYSSENTYWCMLEQTPMSKDGEPASGIQHVIYLVRKIEHLGGSGGAVILALDENTIYQSIRQTSPDSLDSILICDNTGTIISYTDKSFIGSPVSKLNGQLAELDQRNNSIISIKGVPSLCSFMRSESTGWKYITFTSLNSIGIAGEKLTYIIVIIALCTLLAGSLISLISSSLLSAPIRALEALCRRMNHHKKAESAEDSLNLNSLPAEITNQMTRMKEITPLMQDMLLSDLLFTSSWNAQEMKDRMHLIEFEFPFSRFCVLAVQPRAYNLTENYVWQESICQQAHCRFEPEHILSFHIPRKDVCFFLLNFDTDRSCFQNILADWETSVGKAAQIGVGTIVDSIRNIAFSCDQASCGLDYFWLFPERNLLFAEEYGEWERSTRQLPAELVQQLESALTTLNQHKSCEIIAQIMQLLKSGGFCFHVVKNTLQDCTLLLTRAAQKLQLESTIPFPIRLENSQSLEEFQLQYQDAVDQLFDFLNSKRTAANSAQVEKAEHYIQNNIRNRDLSLQLVADYLRISPSHLSKIFKTETGSTFIDYVIHFKLSECKNLLLHSSMRIEEISEVMGYSTPQYFISRFKAAYGVTPKEYRSNAPAENVVAKNLTTEKISL